MSPKAVSEADKQDNAVGREEVTRVVLEQSLKQIPEGEVDPERVEV